jgi:hypothetical protein
MLALKVLLAINGAVFLWRGSAREVPRPPDAPTGGQ